MTEMLNYGGERLDGPGGAPSHWPGSPLETGDGEASE
jgi:hypothetical protein